MSDELIKELSRLQLLSSKCKNKMSMCPLSITLEENRAYLIFNYIKELKEEKQEWINLLYMFKNQQRKFIQYLEDLIKQNETVVEVSKYGLPKNCSKLLIDFYKEILSKYKEIIGSDINVGSIGGKE